MTRPFASLSTLPIATKPVNHIEALRIMVYRLGFEPMSEDARHRLEKVIATYKRLYVRDA